MVDAGSNVLNQTLQTVSLIDQQETFGYNADGTRKTNPYGTTDIFRKYSKELEHKDRPIKADLQPRLNKFFQNVNDSDVAYIVTQMKNSQTMLFSTSPTRAASRNKAAAKDIRFQKKGSQKKTKVFNAESILYESRYGNDF
jgi:hypothetical protein